MRTVLAFLIAPTLTILLLFLIPALTPLTPHGVEMLKIFAAVTYSMTIIFGIPAYLFVSTLNANNLFVYFLVSLALAAPLILVNVFLLAAFANNYLGEPYSSMTRFMIINSGKYMLLSFFTVMVFWLIARPDKKKLR